MTPLTSLKLFRSLILLCFGLAIAAQPIHADIATLREKGPKSGALFSNPGLSEMSADVKIAMRDAQVKILLKKGDGNTLRAECEANFILENIDLAEAAPQEFLVAFPVTGLNSKVVTTDKFAVTVDGKTPPTVFRQSITLSRREAKLQDTAVAGQLDARFAPEKSKFKWGVGLADASRYPDSYVWSQSTMPGTKTQVIVSYVVTLQPQTIRYSKSYHEAPDDREVIPFKDLNADATKGEFFLFDYVLLSGATWDGPIGHEIIRLSVDPKLGLHAGLIETSLRSPVGYINEPLPPDEAPPRTSKQSGSISEDHDDNFVTIELKNAKPFSDLLFAISATSIGPYQPKNK